MPKYPHIIVCLTDRSYDLVGVVAKVGNAMYHADATRYDVLRFTREALATKDYDAAVKLAGEYVTVS